MGTVGPEIPFDLNRLFLLCLVFRKWTQRIVLPFLLVMLLFAVESHRDQQYRADNHHTGIHLHPALMMYMMYMIQCSKLNPWSLCEAIDDHLHLRPKRLRSSSPTIIPSMILDETNCSLSFWMCFSLSRICSSIANNLQFWSDQLTITCTTLNAFACFFCCKMKFT